MAIHSVMMVCLGNICRSPMAEGILRAQLPDIRVNSSGLGAMVGHPAAEPAVALLRAQGVDITAHRAQQISGFLVQNAQLILTAELAQKQFIEKQYPQARGRVFRMCEALGQDVPDPWRKQQVHYEQSLAMITDAMADWAAKIRKIS